MRNDRWFDNDGGTGMLMRDMITLALLGFVAMVILLLPHINPPAKQAKDDIVPPGNVIVEITWPDSLDIDVDLWVEAPGDVPVGYSNQGGVLFNLLRDDLGHQGDATNINYETAYTRGIVPGEYTVNVHLFRNGANTYPVPVIVVLSLKSSKEARTKQILKTTVELHETGEEITAFRFSLTPEGTLIDSSVHSLTKKLRSPMMGNSRGDEPN
ncbi:MAG: hypothetical protein HYT93_01915 [Parcubacteria group bacterium]|nr:hypothetical protein [Parcubacteria group bacterium]